jgi:chorismate mutase
LVQPPEDPRLSRFRDQERRTVAPNQIEIPDYSKVSTTPTGVPYVDWDLYKDYVTDDEKTRWSQEGVQQNYDQQVRVEISKARLAGKPIDEEEALRRVMLKNVGTTVNPSGGDAYLSPTDIKNRQPANSDEVKEYIALNYPSITAAAQQSGLSEAEILATANVVIAHDAAMEYVQTYNPLRQAQIINTMGPDMQGLVGTILQRMFEQGQEQAKVTQEQSGGNWVTDTGRTIWGYSAGPALDFLWDANQFVVNRAVPTAAWSLTAAILGKDPVEAGIETFRATSPNVIADPAAIRVAKEQYGDRTIDVILEVMQTKLSSEDDAIGKLYQKYSDANDFEALEIMDNLLSGTPTDQAIQDAETYLSSSRTGNLGNLMFWSAASWMGINPLSAEGIRAAQSPFLTGIRDSTNILGSFIFDPTLGTSKVSGAYRSARYGLHRISSAKSVEKAFKDRNVRRAFDTFGRSLQYIDDAKDLTISAQRLNTVNSQWKNFFDADAINAMRQAGVRDADSAYEFFRSAENVSLMISGNMARRGNKVLIPHMSKAAAEVKLASMKARGFTYDRNAGKRLDELFNAPVSQMLPEEAIPFIMQQLGSKDGEKFLGRMMSDFVFGDDTAKRTFLGKVFDVMIKRDPGNPRLIRAIDRYGFKRERGVRRFVERRGRIMAHMPDVSKVSISNGKDAYKIRDLLLYGGMPKYWADYSAMVWREMNPGQRMQFATGIGRSVAYARGVDVVDPVRGQRLIDDLTSGFRPGELYAPDMMDLVSLRGMAERLADDVLAGKTKIEGINAATGKGTSLGLAAARQELDTAKRARQELIDAGIQSTDESFKAIQDQIDNLEEFVKKTTVATKDERATLIKEIMEDLKANSPIFNPSRVVDQGQDVTRGLYRNQFADQISFINFEKLDELSMRQSYLTALLGNNPFMTSATDLWTLGTLAGPRFQVRNGIEDAIFFGITNGNWKAFRYGQLVSRAKIEATARPVRAERARSN